MRNVYDDLTIAVTRGDACAFAVSASDEEGTPYVFQPGDVVRLKIFGKKDCGNVVLHKDVPVLELAESVGIFLTEQETRIGDTISKPKDYWYEVELITGDATYTIIGYDENGAKVFRLYPEGAEAPDSVVDPEDIPVVDAELDLASDRPVKNRAIAQKFLMIEKEITELKSLLNGGGGA